VTVRAAREYATLAGLPSSTDDDLQARTLELAEIVEGARLVRRQDNGLEQWRLGRPRKWRLMVSTTQRSEGDLPQLVSVLPSHERTR
jgi:hypothetical protein